MKRARIRQAVLVAGLVLSLVASWWAYRQESLESDVAAPAQRSDQQSAPLGSAVTPAAISREGAPTAVAPHGEVRLDLNRLHARELAGTDIDPFRTKSWFVPPPPPPPEPPPKPTAPPLPFQFVGNTEEVGSGKPVIYLANGNEFYTVTVGETFAGSYRLERVDRNALAIRYLPLSILQTLQIGSSER